MRALQLYAPKADRAAYDHTIQLAAAWLAKARSTTNEDRIARVLGLVWADRDKDATQIAVRELLATQRADGGWSDLDSLESSAYTTGRSLVALQSAQLPASDAAYQRAVKYLLNTQQADGSWYVKTRAMALQPYFDAGFPHGFDQWISAGGDELGDIGAVPGVPGHHGDGISWAIALQFRTSRDSSHPSRRPAPQRSVKQMVKRNVLPSPGTLSTSVRPCIESIRPRRIASPSPVPP
jgi:hypothetical protein